MVTVKTVYQNLIFIECLLLYIAEGQYGGVGQAGTNTSFDAGEQSIKSYYFCQSSLQHNSLTWFTVYFILEGSEQKVESVILDDNGTSAGASCLDQRTLILFSLTL